MITGILGLLVTIIFGILGIYFKYFRGKAPAVQVAQTDHAMLQDAVNQPTNADVVNDLRNGKF